MGFIDSYKHLEKLCGDMLQTQHGVSAYIAEMESTPNGSYRVQGWVEDLKCLKHYRWVRNQIVHDPNSSEENMCDLSDAQWIDNFYDRIMKQADPLAMYQKATKPRPIAKPKPLRQAPQAQYTYSVQPVYSKKKAKKAILDIGQRMYVRNFVAANDGNISIRTGENEVWATPTGVSKGFMKKKMLGIAAGLPVPEPCGLRKDRSTCCGSTCPVPAR